MGGWREVATYGGSVWDGVRQAFDPAQVFVGTWSSALLGIFSAVGDLQRGNFSLLWGSTYLDVAESLIPGPVARLIGYERPLEFDRGLAWQLRFGEGGTHIDVAAVLNFSGPGVLVVLLLLGLAFGYVDMRASSGRPLALLAYAALIVNMPGFLWYGELYGARALMTAVLLWWAYRIVLLVGFRMRPRQHTSAARPQLGAVGSA